MADPVFGYTLAQNSVDLSSTSSNNVTPNNGNISYANASNIKPLSEYVNSNASIAKPLPDNIPLRYPYAQLEDTSDWLEIKIVKYLPSGFGEPGSLRLGTSTSAIRNKQSGSIRNPVKYIHLPIPKELLDVTSVDWGPDRLDPFSGLAAGAIEGTIENPGDIGNIIKNAYGSLMGSFQTGEGQKGTTSAVMKKVINSFGGNVSANQLLKRSSGTVTNPNLELLFNGPMLRSFDFTFEFAPRDSYEGQVVKKIIREFKKAMTPKTSAFGGPGSGLLISSPDVFEIKYKSGNADHPFLNAFKTCALTNVILNYTASGNYSTYSDGTPVHSLMNLSFTELSPIYTEDYDTEEAGPGVGY